MRSRLLALGALLSTTACSESDPETTPLTNVDARCAELELELPDGRCIRPGIPPEGCAPGFVHDGEYGCEPVLPPEPCPPGLMAVPGESACRPVMPCGRGTWGDLPVDSMTEFVDVSYTGVDSDGSAQKPWPSIGAAFDAAEPGALVAVAEGEYLEDVVITGKPVKLWGVCPEKVTIVGVGPDLGALALLDFYVTGSHVRGIALRGASNGLFVSGARDVTVEHVWAHDTAERGIEVNDSIGTTSVNLRDSLLEGNHGVGVLIGGSEVTVEATLVRGTLPSAVDALGVGVAVNVLCHEGVCDPARPGKADVRGSLIEQNYEAGVILLGSEATVEASVVRSTLPRTSDQDWGHGISIQACVSEGCNPPARSHAVVRASLVEKNHAAGIYVSGSDALLDAIVVRDTLPRASTQMSGDGIALVVECLEDICDPNMRADGTVSRSLIENNHASGMFVPGSKATVELTVVRDTLPQALDQAFGRGIGIEIGCPHGICDPALRASGSIRGSLIENNHELSLFVAGSDAVVEDSVVRGSRAQASDGLFGDGVCVGSIVAPATATITSVIIADSARAGLSNFGADVSLGLVAIECAALPLVGEPWGGMGFVFEDGGGNVCGCSDEIAPCKAVSTGLTPPGPLGGD